MPVIARTLLYEYEDIGHYRVVKGYDDALGEFIQDDSMQGRDLRYSYDSFNRIWKKFNYEYLVLVPKEKQEIAKAILKEDASMQKAWEKAAVNARAELENSPSDFHARFNLSVALYNAGDYHGSVSEYEKVEDLLSFRTLWYQMEPIEAYAKLGNQARVFDLTDKIFNNQNRGFSELYFLRGEMYQKQGNNELARQEYQNAVYYNRNFEPVKKMLEE